MLSFFPQCGTKRSKYSLVSLFLNAIKKKNEVLAIIWIPMNATYLLAKKRKPTCFFKRFAVAT